MKLNLTHLILVIDRSGSMVTSRDDVTGGVNTLLDDQQRAEGECTASVYLFNDRIDQVGRTDIANVPRLTRDNYVPRGGTALYDAIGVALDVEGAALAAMPEEERPGLVVLVIATDGQERDSLEYTLAGVREKITEQQHKYGWSVKFLGVGLEAFGQAEQLGVFRQDSARVDGANVGVSYSSTSDAITRGRTARAGGQSLGATREALAFTADEREAMIVPPDPGASGIVKGVR